MTDPLAWLFALLIANADPCPAGAPAYTVNERYADGSTVVGIACDTGSEGPSVSLVRDAAGRLHLDVYGR